MVKSDKGCTFGQVLQQKVIGIEDKVVDGFKRIDIRLQKIESQNIKMFNHLSSRQTPESARNDKIMWAIMGGMGSVLLFLIGLLFYGARVS